MYTHTLSYTYIELYILKIEDILSLHNICTTCTTIDHALINKENFNEFHKVEIIF